MAAQRNQPSTRPADITRAESTTAREASKAVARDRLKGRPLMVWEDNIDLGEGIIPIHLLNLVCAVHLRQEHGFKRWRISKFEETYPWLIREDGTFAFAALHYLVHGRRLNGQ